ncbi:MAG: methionyl-tRNA formyltransferase [Actinomycetota bacterium]|nr:methionyl-tRNA formyltransferase [Actinomycetota bacterium]MDA3018883.1 methionyl-tRNA formyltransferase [Actinomycetota bacterium]
MVEELAPLPVGPVRRVAFLGTPELAVPVLRSLVGAGIDVGHVVTRVDKRRARGNELYPSPVKVAALELGLTVSHKVDDLLEQHRVKPFDLAVVVAYGALIKPHVLAEIPMVNLHVSLLPKWRGAAPIERALLAGDSETGVCLMQIEEGLDTGGVIGLRTMTITDLTTADDIRSQLIAQGSQLLIEQLKSGLDPVMPQVGVATYAEKIDSSELRIDWSRSAHEISRLIRLGNAWTVFRGKRLKIHQANVIDGPSSEVGSISVTKISVHVATGHGTLELKIVQPGGKPRMDVVSWINGNQPTHGEKLLSE